MFRLILAAAIILLGLLIVPVGFLAGFIGGMPNRLAAPLVEQWPLFKILWASNPGAAVHVLVQQPLMVIAHSGSAGGTPAWQLFLYPVSLAVQLAVAIFAAAILCSGSRGAMFRGLVPLLPGMATLVFVTTYAQVAFCCTGGPRWVLDIGLFSLASDPLSTWIDWRQLYLRIGGAVPIIQAVLALLGAALLAVSSGKNS